MPGLLSSIQRYDMSTGIPKAVWTALYANAARANLVLPHAEKVFGHQKFTPKIVSTEQLWLVYSKPGTSEIQFVLSCTEGPLGKYPLYIIPTVPAQDLTPELLKSSMEALCSALLSESGLTRARVFSVFSIEKVTEAFVREWEEVAKINRIEEPYYSAIFSVCTASTLVRQQRPPRPSGDVVLEPRLAAEQDVDQVALLCCDFAATSPPFILTDEKAREEARLLIANRQLWVLEMQKRNGNPEIATIVAVTRKSEGVATITKVYTPEKWRGNGGAERLVRHVCIELLEKYKQIVLYVGVDNCAKVVYDRVGFQGLSEGSSSSERWLEMGFDENKVELGHW
ncbi:hypothetical protein DFJ58DRAFT_867114 [Suillus subalutaceus]|uniref:uncharacterized protein n=1 Tax=Suillus subalutaceus TaxID=48586 RepID=UPI001B88616C|nr:uncharacterized protein DFJ58DRAFT_867114 [Suillus subalutaceus]KAG1864725.1 hypothetical protein DFJ58DRAFT_867114 [Suillus subalutaceus]